ncbi:hypothetical protein ACIBAG_44090 [Streptomyces sp. NPDC051243]|uniref:hypothetical protein n=1 Tax=Streptomyces sp. NPDC051243 TaxID=3365646 RepID=UPI0037A6F362
MADTALYAPCYGPWPGFPALAHRRIRTLAASPEPPALTPRQTTTTALTTVAPAMYAAALLL